MRTSASRSRAPSNGPFGRLAPFAKAPTLPKSSVNSVTTRLVSLNSTSFSTIARVFSVAMLSCYRVEPIAASVSRATQCLGPRVLPGTAVPRGSRQPPAASRGGGPSERVMAERIILAILWP